MDNALLTFLLGWVSAVLGWGAFRLVVLDRTQKRPAVVVSISRSAMGRLDLLVSNCGDAFAIEVQVGVAGEFDGQRLYNLGGIAAGGEALLSSICPQSAWLDVEVLYADARSRLFRSRRLFQLTSRGVYRGGKVVEDRPRYRKLLAWWSS